MSKIENIPKNNWDKILSDLAKKKLDVCAICYNDVYDKQVYVLNCKHVFHQNCFNSFEKFENFCKKCPICRSEYEKKPFLFSNH